MQQIISNKYMNPSNTYLLNLNYNLRISAHKHKRDLLISNTNALSFPYRKKRSHK